MECHPQLRASGEQAIVVEFGNEISPELNAVVRTFAAALQAQRVEGIREVVPTYRSLLVYFDPLQVEPEALEERLAALASSLHELTLPEPTLTVIPVCYGGEHGPDLPDVCTHTGLTADQVVRLHSEARYLIYMLGFTPGFPYLGGMDPRIAVPRLESPRTKVPAGSVGIAGNQTGIYPIESPGGWRVIGRTPLRLYDPACDPPTLLAPGHYLKFRPISPAEFAATARAVEAGTYRVEVVPSSGE